MSDDSLAGGRRRVVIENITPNVDGGRYPSKTTMGEAFVVEADAFTDGYDSIRAMVRIRRHDVGSWRELPMAHLGNDRWRATINDLEIGRYELTVVAWVDHFGSWQRDLN